jgi:hypothetical protein
MMGTGYGEKEQSTHVNVGRQLNKLKHAVGIDKLMGHGEDSDCEEDECSLRGVLAEQLQKDSLSEQLQKKKDKAKKDGVSGDSVFTQFKQFLDKEHSVENLLFWMEAEEVRHIPDAEEGRQYLKHRVEQINKKYVSTEAKTQVNLPVGIVKGIAANLEDPDKDIFQKAQQEVFLLMDRDVFPRFLKTQPKAQPSSKSQGPVGPSKPRKERLNRSLTA